MLSFRHPELVSGSNENIPEIKTGAKEFLEVENKLDKFITDVTNVKEPAYLHIDDRCICFNGDFKKIIDDIKNFEVYWK